MHDLRIAAVSCHCPIGQWRDNLAKMEKWVRIAHEKGVDLVCFPEMNLTGYCNRSEMRENALQMSGPVGAQLTEMARKYLLVILAGMAEADEQGRVYASHLVIQPEGEIGCYRKVHIAPPEKKLYTPGNQVPLFNIQGTTFGIQLCYDVHFPELSTRMALEGAEVIFAPHASPRGTPATKYDSWMRHLTARAFDNGIFVVACNQTGENCNGLTFPGVAMVVGPSGELIASRCSDEDGLLVADLRADELEAVRSHPMRYFLPNRRPDIY